VEKRGLWRGLEVMMMVVAGSCIKKDKPEEVGKRLLLDVICLLGWEMQRTRLSVQKAKRTLSISLLTTFPFSSLFIHLMEATAQATPSPK